MAAPPSTRTAPIRSSIYRIVDGGNDTHTLHRIDTSSLFAAGAECEQPGSPEAIQPAADLPRPLARRQFLPLGRGVEKIVSVDRNRHTVIFDTRTDSVCAGPDARHVKWHAHGDTWAEAGGRLYHLGRGPGHEEQKCLDFESLIYDDHRDDWFWNLLPSPPVASYRHVHVVSFADADAGAASTIRISTRNYGTYAFDAARTSWRKEGDWALPFRGRAQYVADYGLWFGFTDDGASDLCAADLNAAGRPAFRHVWADVDGNANHDDSWLELSYLSYMGSGRFCVTRFLRETDSGERFSMTAVVTAVEATRDAASATGELLMVSRASVRYQCPVCDSPCWAY